MSQRSLQNFQRLLKTIACSPNQLACSQYHVPSPQTHFKYTDSHARAAPGLSSGFCSRTPATGNAKRYPNKQTLFLQGDTSGSVEAVKSALLQLPQDRVALRFLLATTGDLNAGDVQLASASQANIIGFNMEPSDTVLAHTKQTGLVWHCTGPVTS